LSGNIVEADEGFATLAGVPVETLSQSEMAAVEGKLAVALLTADRQLLDLPLSDPNNDLALVDLESLGLGLGNGDRGLDLLGLDADNLLGLNLNLLGLGGAGRLLGISLL
jgi:hypothetical protein